jgi:amino acid transporter/mannitol/fructose-specific phosphotransferase system IIA component (Ntr-type)
VTDHRPLGLFGVFSIAAGAMISSGLFVLPGVAFAEAGPSVVLAYVIAGAMVLPSIFAQVELATAMPKSGGSYLFIERSLGSGLGMVAGLLNWLAITLKATFACVGLGGIAVLIHPGSPVWLVKGVALAAVVFFAVLNLFSVRGAGRFQNLLVLGLIVILGAYVGFGVGKVEGGNFRPFLVGESMLDGFNSLFAVAGMVFVSFGGMNAAVDVAEEVRQPGRNIPRGMFLSFAVVMILYAVVVLVTVGVLEAGELTGSLTAVSQGARAVMGTAGLIVVTVAGGLAFATTANGGLMAASRSPMAMSRDGLVPEFFSKTNRRFGTPHLAIVVTASLMALLIVGLSVENLIKTASTMLLLMLMLTNVAVLIMRHSGLRNYRPRFRSPLFPWLQWGALVVYGFLIVEMGAVPLVLTGLFALGAMGWYLAYVRPRVDRESGFVYLVSRLASQAIRDENLERELHHIALEREGIEPDWFDEKVRTCPVLDIDRALPARELFRTLAEALAPRVGASVERLHMKFIHREHETSTVVYPGVAVPHVIVEGEGVFEVMLVRCRPGATFSELNPPVQAAFVLAGSTDTRNLHLKALMKVAHVVQEEGFVNRWMKAKGEDQIRNVVLLSPRERETRS